MLVSWAFLPGVTRKKLPADTKKPPETEVYRKKMERAMRFELTTSTLARWRSTTELRPHMYRNFPYQTQKPPEGGPENGAGDEIRTHDIHLGKVALYH
jgi:hypothetical protein